MAKKDKNKLVSRNQAFLIYADGEHAQNELPKKSR